MDQEEENNQMPRPSLSRQRRLFKCITEIDPESMTPIPTGGDDYNWRKSLACKWVKLDLIRTVVQRPGSTPFEIFTINSDELPHLSRQETPAIMQSGIERFNNSKKVDQVQGCGNTLTYTERSQGRFGVYSHTYADFRISERGRKNNVNPTEEETDEIFSRFRSPPTDIARGMEALQLTDDASIQPEVAAMETINKSSNV